MNRYAEIIARRRPSFGGAGIDTREESKHIASHYLYFRRKRGLGAQAAMRAALELPAAYIAGKGYYGDAGPWGEQFERAGDKLRYCESPESSGLRLVGYADEIARLRHTGWYTNDHGDTGSLRGAVWQATGRNGFARLLYGYVNTEYGGALVCVGEIVESRDNEDLRQSDEARQAARWADQLAEHAAESERDYNRAYDAGRAAAEIDSELIRERRELLPVLAEYRAVRRGRATVSDLVRDMLQSRIRAGLDAIDVKREERENAWGDCYGADEQAWLSGFMDAFDIGNGFVRAVRLGYVKASDWKGAPDANPCHAESVR